MLNDMGYPVLDEVDRPDRTDAVEGFYSPGPFSHITRRGIGEPNQLQDGSELNEV